MGSWRTMEGDTPTYHGAFLYGVSEEFCQIGNTEICVRG